MFGIAVITFPERLPMEAQALRLVGQMPAVLALHLRKPGWSEEATRRLLDELPEETRKKIRLHDHFELAGEYGLQGVHLNRRHPRAPQEACSLSASCHSLEEVQTRKAQCRYVFLSPIFDSVSKQGYASGFSSEELHTAAKDGIIDRKVFALGGVRSGHVPFLKEIGFGGAGMIGEIWQGYAERPDTRRLATTMRNIMKQCM